MESKDYFGIALAFLFGSGLGNVLDQYVNYPMPIFTVVLGLILPFLYFYATNKDSDGYLISRGTATGFVHYPVGILLTFFLAGYLALTDYLVLMALVAPLAIFILRDNFCRETSPNEAGVIIISYILHIFVLPLGIVYTLQHLYFD